MDENLHKQMVFDAKRKSVGVAYLCWLLLGGFGAHRFYAGNKKSGAVQLLLLLSFVGWIVLIPWLLIDLALIPGMINEKNMETINQLNGGDRTDPAESAPRIETELDPKREAMLEDLRKTGYKRERRDNSHVYR